MSDMLFLVGKTPSFSWNKDGRLFLGLPVCKNTEAFE
jgi:hypothetical protein